MRPYTVELLMMAIEIFLDDQLWYNLANLAEWTIKDAHQKNNIVNVGNDDIFLILNQCHQLDIKIFLLSFNLEKILC